MKSQPRLDDFIAYCKAHPTERFWQAVRNFTGSAFIYQQEEGNALSHAFDIHGNEIKVIDTFYE